MDNRHTQFNTVKWERDSNNYGCLCNYIISGIKELSDVIQITTDDRQLRKNMKELCFDHKRYMVADIVINIKYKRYGRMRIELVRQGLSESSHRKIFHTNIMVLDDYSGEYKCRAEFNELFKNIMDKIGGFCGTMGLESSCWDILNITDVSTHIGDGVFYGIENVLWKPNIIKEEDIIWSGISELDDGSENLEI